MTNISRYTKLILVLFGTFLALSITAKESETLLFKNVKLFDGVVLHDSVDLLISGDKIAGVFTENKPADKDVDFVIDASGKTIIPGLINAHVHISNKNEEKLKVSAEAGILSVIDLFSKAETGSKMRAYRDRPGYAYFYSSGPVATPPGGHGTQYGFATPTLKEPGEAAAFVKDRISEKSDVLKIILEDAGGRIPHLSSETVSALVRESKKAGLVSVVHTSTVENAMIAFNAGANGIAHSWFRASNKIGELDLEKLASKKFFVTPTLLINNKFSQIPKEKLRGETFATMKNTLSDIKRLHEKGVTILAGTDAPNFGINHGTDFYQELYLLVEAGLSPLETIKAATSNIASHYQLEDRGVLQSGKRADFLLIDGNPTLNIKDIENIVGIWQAGTKIK